MSKEEPTEAPNAGARRGRRTFWRRWRRRILLSGMSLLVVVILLVVCLPLYSPLFSPLIEAALEKRLGWETSLEHLSVNLIESKASLRGLSVREGPRKQSLAVEEASADFELLPLLKGEIRVPELRLSGPRLLVERDEAGRLNWAEVLAGRAPRPEPGGPRGAPRTVTANVLLHDGSVTLEDARTGLSVDLSDVYLDVRVDGFEEVVYGLTARVRAGRTTGRAVGARFGLGLKGEGGLQTAEDARRLSARGRIAASRIATEGLLGEQLRRRSASLNYDFSTGPAGAMVEKLAFDSDYLSFQVEGLTSDLFTAVTERVRRLAAGGADRPFAGEEPVAVPEESRALLQATADLEAIGRDFGPELARVTEHALEALQGTAALRMAAAADPDGRLRMSGELSLEDPVTAGRLGAGDGEGAVSRSYRTAFGSVVQSCEVVLGDEAASLNAKLNATASPSAGGGSALRLETQASCEREAAGAGGLTWRLRQETMVDLAGLSAAAGELLAAARLLPEDTAVEGVVREQIDVAAAEDAVKVAGRGRVDGLMIQSPLLREVLGGERVAPDAFQWWHDCKAGMQGHGLQVLHFAPGEGERFGLSHSGADIDLAGRVEGLDGAISGWKMDGLNLRVDLRPADLPLAVRELLERGGVGLSPARPAEISARLDGTPEALRVEPRLTYDGRVTLEGTPPALAAAETPIELDLSLFAAPPVLVEGLASFARSEGSRNVRVSFLEVADEASFRLAGSEGLLAGLRPRGSIRWRDSGVELADLGGQLRLYPSRLRDAANRWFPGALPPPVQAPELSGTAAVTGRVTGVLTGPLRVLIDADMDSLGIRWSPEPSMEVVRKAEGTPLRLDGDLGLTVGEGWQMSVERATARMGGIRARASFLLDGDGLRGTGPDGPAFLEVSPFDEADVAHLIPALADCGVSGMEATASARGLEADFASGHVRARLSGSLDLAEVDATRLREAFRRLSDALPGAAASEGAVGREDAATAERPEMSAAPTGGLRERLRHVMGRARVRVGALLLDGPRVEQFHGLVLFDGEDVQSEALLHAVADVYAGDAFAGRMEMKCRSAAGAFPYDTARLRARAVSGPLRGAAVEGWVDGLARAAPSVQGRFVLPRLEVDSELLDVLPGRYRELVRPYSIGGTVHGSGFVSRPAGGELRYSADLTLNGGRFDAKSPPLALYGLSAAVHADERRVQVPRFTAKAWGGRTEGSLFVDLATQAGASPRFEYSMRMMGASLAQLGGRLGGAAAELEGRVSAYLDARGNVADPLSLVGRGDLTIEEARLAELPIFVSLFNVFSLGLPGKTVFDRVEIEARFAGGRATLPAILLSSNTVDITGKGLVTFGGDCDLVMAVASSERPKKGIPLLTNALNLAVRAVQRTVFPPVRLTGKVWEPRIRVMAMRPITRPLESIRGLIPLLPDPQEPGGADAVAGIRSYGTW